MQYRNKNTNTTIVGTTPEYQQTSNTSVEKGTFFTADHVTYRQRVCVLGKTVVGNLFDDGIDPVGQTIKIRGLIFQVLGVMKEKGVQGPFTPDDQIFIPVTTAMKRVFGTDYVSSISVQVVDKNLMGRVAVKHQQRAGYAHGFSQDEVPMQASTGAQ